MKTMRDRIAFDVSQSLSEFEFAPAYPEAITGDVAVVSILSQPDRNHPEQGTVMVQIRPLAFPDKYPSELEEDRRDMIDGVLQGWSPDSFKEYFRQDLHWLDQERVSNDDIRGLRLQLHTTDSTASTPPHISMTDDQGRALFEGVNLFSKYTLGLEPGMTSPAPPTAERTLYRIPPVGKALGAASSPQRARPSQQQAGRCSHAGGEVEWAVIMIGPSDKTCLWIGWKASTTDVAEPEAMTVHFCQGSSEFAIDLTWKRKDPGVRRGWIDIPNGIQLDNEWSFYLE